MSRGLGKLQRGLLVTIRRHGKPMTFADIRADINEGIGAPYDGKLRSAFERSARRALHQLCSHDFPVLIAMGSGGPGDPLRYFIHPLQIGTMGDTPEARALRVALEADSHGLRGRAYVAARRFDAWKLSWAPVCFAGAFLFRRLGQAAEVSVDEAVDEAVVRRVAWVRRRRSAVHSATNARGTPNHW
jgi:hypothetical protein